MTTLTTRTAPSRSAGAESTPRRRRRLANAALSVLAAAAVLTAAPNAYAHELGLVLVAPGASGSRADAVDGFRLAVDESPDVSHPAGEAAGDHLGGIDVETTLVTGRSASADRRVARAVAAGARVVVVLAPGAGAGETFSAVRATRPLIVLAGMRGTPSGDPDALAVLLQPRSAAKAELERLAQFERRFTDRYARAVSATARTGYNAGKLLDSLLAQLGEGPFAEPALAAAVARAERDLVAATASLVRPRRVQTPAATSDNGTSPRRGARVLLVLGGAAAALAVAVLLLRSRRRRSLV